MTAPGERALERYLDFLRQHRGLAADTVSHHRTAIREFLRLLDSRQRRLEEVDVADLDAFLAAVRSRGAATSTVYNRVSSLRLFLAYLFAEGWMQADLSGHVVSPRMYTDADVPPHYVWHEVETLQASVVGQTPEALRDRAMLALFCTYGLRAGEVASLTLDDLDWNHERLTVPRRKNRQPLVLPLLSDVRSALRAYITDGRPVSASPQLLLAASARPLSMLGVFYRLRTLVRQAGLPWKGTHALRRAVGTRLVEAGYGLGTVATILGHRSLRSARVYVRLSVNLLRDVADNYGDLL